MKKNHFRLLTKLTTFVLTGTMAFGPWMTAYAEKASEDDNTSFVEEEGNGRKKLTGLLPVKTNFYHRDSSSSSKPMLGFHAQDLPARYRADEQEWAEGIKVKNQDKMPSCWAFAITTCAEYSYAKETYEELGPVKEISPGHLAYFVYNRQPDPLGNTAGDSSVPIYHWSELGSHYSIGGLEFLSQWSGLCLEEKAPYSNIDDHITDMGTWDGSPEPYDASLAYDDYVVIEKMDYKDSADRNEIKDMIMKYGAVGGTVQMDTDIYFNWDTNAFYNYKDGDVDHAVVIVGWDDDYPRENFTHTTDRDGNPLKNNWRTLSEEEAARLTTPEGNGAWIVQNSWGDYLDHGFFYVSYYSEDLPKGCICTFDMMDADTYKYNFFYDGTLSDFHSLDDDIYGYSTQKGTKAANVFVNTTGGNITVDAVGFTNYDDFPSHYNISVYTDLQDPNDPESGLLSATAAVITENPSIQTVKLDNPVLVGEGGSYSVVLSFPEEECALGVEKPGEDATYINTVQTDPGQSFFRGTNSDHWIDLNNYNACYRIRAFANPTDAIPQLKIVEEPDCLDTQYDGKAHKLATSGKIYNGDFLFALTERNDTAPEEGYSTEIPTAVNMDVYYVWYKAKSKYTEEETEPKYLTTVIGHREITITAKDQSKDRNGEIDTSVDQVTVDGLADGDRLVSINLEVMSDTDDAKNVYINPSCATIYNQDNEDVTLNYVVNYKKGKLSAYKPVDPTPTPVPYPVNPDPVPVTPGTTPVVVTPEPDPAAEKLQADKEAFISYKNEQKSYAESLAAITDSNAIKRLIMDAKAEITSLSYDENLTLEQNKNKVDDIIKQLKTDLSAQRESEKKTDYSSEWVKGKWYNKDGTQTYKPVGKWHKNKKGWWYEDESGWYPKKRWQKIDGNWYYFKADGYAAAGEFVQGWWLDSKTCKCTYPYKAGWHKNKTGWWYGDASGWYAKNGTYIIDGKAYKFNKKGYLVK